ncbi:MAG: DegT/DnrJ/EryC1/StrS family aminotransferase [Bacteroidales bacterium]|nr:DegT/DnrJ/EryC1/StrS family aminotransferase [Bacteroidales bacterium]
MQFRDLIRQYQHLKPSIDQAMLQVAASGSYIMSEAVTSLENRLAQYVGVRHCITCANGTDALYLALRCWDIGPGDLVFVPDFTFFASAEVVAMCGATPVFVDVDSRTFNISPDDLESKIASAGTLYSGTPRAVIAVDLFGLPANYDAIRPIAHKHGLHLLEDGAQGFGGSLGHRRACSFGDIATTSFFPAKPLGCYGDGGALFTDSDEWASLLRSLRVHGKGTDKYDNVRIGLNSRLDALQAAILDVKLTAFANHELDAVNQAAAQYSSLLAGSTQCPCIPDGYTSSWAQYTITLANPSRRDQLRQQLQTMGIPTAVYYPKPMHAQTAFAKLPPSDCPIASSLAQSVLSLPIHPYITQQEIQQVATALIQRFR